VENTKLEVENPPFWKNSWTKMNIYSSGNLPLSLGKLQLFIPPIFVRHVRHDAVGSTDCFRDTDGRISEAQTND